MNKIVFSSDQLPAHLDDNARFARWRDLCAELFCTFELSRLQDRPFAMQLQYAKIGSVALGSGTGTMSSVARTKAAIGIDGSDELSLGINMGSNPLRLRQGSRELMIEPGGSVLFAHFETWDWQTAASTTFVTLNLPRTSLSERVADVEDLLSRPLDRNNVALRHLWRYAGFLMEAGLEDGGRSDVEEHVGDSLIDLVALSLGAEREAAEQACLRGLRAARLQQVLAGIKVGFSDPAFTTDSLAQRLGLSRRYVNDILFRTGSSFAERVLELRLQKARRMLTDDRGASYKVGEVAYACGFSEISYFNRCFRRRFGITPTHLRDRNGAADSE